jgi:hypothetical protein
VKCYVEGGGDSHTLKIACRAGFSLFLSKAGLKGRMPRIVACGSRQNAYDSFCTAINSGEDALLLVDSESSVAENYQQGEATGWQPWHHLQNRQGDQWEKPDNATEKDCHLMTQCMEAWFLADREALEDFFGQGFNGKALPAEENRIESIGKEQICQALTNATKNCKTKARYDKGKHSFKLLEMIEPDKVITASPWAKRLIEISKTRIGC